MATKPRYSLSEIGGVKESYRASPNGTDGVGQLVFALNVQCSTTLLGCCYQGNCLIPWGICCCFAPNQTSTCSNVCCVKTGFGIGSSSTCYLALGSTGGCGATLFRRIT